MYAFAWNLFPHQSERLATLFSLLNLGSIKFAYALNFLLPSIRYRQMGDKIAFKTLLRIIRQKGKRQ